MPRADPVGADRLRLATVAVAVAGIAVAGYLTIVHYTGLEPVCGGGAGGCERVQSSVYSDLAGVPVALLGLIGYIAILGGVLLLRGEAALLVPAALAIGGFGFSLYLQYRSLFTLEASCIWCIASAVLMGLLMGLTVARALRAP
jgi:uncharacterized membrane protein